MVDLKPCPFCGGEAVFVSVPDGPEKGSTTISCVRVGCIAHAGQHYDSAESVRAGLAERWNRRSSLSAAKPEEPDAPGIAEAPDGTLPCVYCSNENLCVEIRDDKHPGMCGFSVVCGSSFCGARGPVRPAQMDAVEEWNRAYRWVHPPKGDAPKPASEEQGEPPTIEECIRSAHEAIKSKHPNTAALAAMLTEDERECVVATRALCLASRAPSPSPALSAISFEEVERAYDDAKESDGRSWSREAGLRAVMALYAKPAPALAAQLIEAAKRIDWVQIGLNGDGCFHLEDGRFCLRGHRWPGHGGRNPVHLYEPLYVAMTRIAKASDAAPALAALVEAGDAMRAYFDETTLTMNRIRDKEAPGLMWALTEEYVDGAAPLLAAYDAARAEHERSAEK